MNIDELIVRGVNVTLTAADLREYSLQLIDECLQAKMEAKDVEMSEAEAAAYLKVTTATLQRWRRDGTIAADYAVGSRYVYRRTTLEEFKKIKNIRTKE